MSIPSAIAQGVQIGDETVYGTDVTADTKLQALSLSLSPDLAFEEYRAAGNKFVNTSAITRIASEVTVEDSPLTYTEAHYPFSSLFGAATITTEAGMTLARQWEFIVSPSGADAPVSFTVQRGDGTNRQRANGVVIGNLDITWEVESGVSISGGGFGGAITNSAGVMDTLAGTQPALIPVNWTQVSVYMDDLPGTLTEANIDLALGTTKLTRAFAASPSFGDRYERVFALDAAQGGSPVGIVEIPVTFTLDLQMAADSVGRGLMAAAEAGTPKLIRVEAVGPLAEAGVNYSIIFDMHGTIADGGDEDERNGAQQISWTFTQTSSDVWEKAMRIRLVNLATAL